MAVASWIGIMVLVGVGILVLGGLATMFVLLANKRTRAEGVGLMILGMLALVIFVVVIGMFFFTGRGHGRPATVEQIGHFEARVQARRDPDNLHIEAQAAANEARTAAVEAFEIVQGDVAKPVTLPADSPPEVVPESATAEETPNIETTAEETPEAAAETTEGETHTDAVASESPEETPVAPVEPAAPARPAWVDAGPGTVDGARQVVVEVGPYKTAEGCDLEQPVKLQAALNQYVQRFINPAAVRHVRFTPTLYEQVVKETWEETGEFTVGPMLHRYLLLRFDNKAMRLIEEQYRQMIVQRRVWCTGLGLTGIVLLLGVAFTVLRIDLALDGKYRIRMALATMMALALLAFVALVGVRFLGIARFAPQPVQATAAKVMPMPIDSPSAVTIPAAYVAQAQVAQETPTTPRKSIKVVTLLGLASVAGFVVLLLVSAVIAFRKRHKRRFEGVGVSGNIEP